MVTLVDELSPLLIKWSLLFKSNLYDICFMVSLEIFVLKLFYHAEQCAFPGMRSFNCSGEKFPPQWQGMIGPNLTWVPPPLPPTRGPSRYCQWQTLPCLSLVNLHSLVQCQALFYRLHTPEVKGLLFGLEEALFLGMPCLQFLFRCATIKTLDILIFL